MLIGDTDILATSLGKRCKEELDVLLDYSTESDMLLNTAKTKFMCINGDKNDLLPFHAGPYIIDQSE